MDIGFFEFVIILVGIGTVSGIITSGMQVEKRRLKLKASQADGEVEALKNLVADMHGEMSALKQRVQVLERLATDGDRQLAAEIERLRRDAQTMA
jgi:hypothetical protein